MAADHRTLRNLLAAELPLDLVGPRLRQAARRALRADDTRGMAQVAQAVAGELLRRGDLLRVAVQQPAVPGAQPRALCLLRGSNRLVDLTVLGGRVQALVLPPDPEAADRDRPSKALPPVPAQSYGGVAGVLGAMEDAQDLAIGDLHSAEKGVVLGGILRLLRKFTPQFRLYILLAEDEALPPEPHGVFTMPPGDTRCLWLEQRTAGQSVWIPTPAELPPAILADVAPTQDRDFGATEAVAVPLWEPEALLESGQPAREVGLLFVVANETWGRDALLRLADRLTRFVTRRWQNQWEVNQRIHTDSLTGAFNRAHFDEQFTLELERARRSNFPMTLILGDLDHFKLVNDNYGHQAGDTILKMVARRMREELRRIDHICRIGGEEFGLILPDTGVGAARDVAMRLLDAPLSAEVMHDGEPVPLTVTFSYGAVTFPEAGADAFELYRKADAMQYLSKDMGRNRCHFWNSDGEHVQLLPTNPGR